MTDFMAYSRLTYGENATHKTIMRWHYIKTNNIPVRYSKAYLYVFSIERLFEKSCLYSAIGIK